MSVEHVWAGALSDTGVTVKGRVSGSGTSVRLAVSEQDDLSSPTYFGPDTSDADNMVELTATGLDADTRYYYALEDGGVLDTAFSGTFKTHPVAVGERASYVFGAAGDAGLTGDGDDSYVTSAVSDNPVFDTMRAQAAAEDWAWFSHLGDLHYRNIATATASLYRGAFNDTLTFNGTLGASARQGRFLRDVGVTYVWDDHDFGPNDSDRTDLGNATANTVYRERVPHYTLPSASAIYQSWQVGRVLYIASDVRSARDPNTDPQTASKTMLGTAQKAWMEALLAANANGAEALVWISPSRWVGGSDTWASFTHERDAMVEMFGDLGWLHRMIFMTADMHALSICSGPANPYGRFPMFMFAGMDSGAWSTGSEYDIGSEAGRQQYGTMRVVDNGHTIELRGTGWQNGTEWKTYSKFVDVGSPVLALDYEAGHISPPLEPTPDDQQTRNSITAKRPDGSEATVTQDTGPLSIQAPPDGVGLYDEEVTVEVASDAQLRSQAGRHVHLGTVDEDRYPVVHIDLAANPALADDVTELIEGDRLTIANPPPWLPPDPIDQIVEGSTEVIGAYDWDVTYNCSPASPWAVAQVGPDDPADAGPDEPNRADTRGCTLVAAVDADDTEWLLLTEQGHVLRKDRWIISDGLDTSGNLPDEFPFDLRTDGEVVRVTACEPLVWDSFTRSVSNDWGTASSGQAWSTAGGSASDRDVNGTTGRVTLASAPTTVRLQTIGEAVGDCDVTAKVAASQTATGQPLVAAVVVRYASSSDFYRVRVHFGTTGEVFTSLTRGPGTQISSTLDTGLTYTPGAQFNVRMRVAGHRVQAKVWPDGDSEPHFWHQDLTVTADTIDTGTVGLAASAFSGNTNVSPILSFDDFEVFNPQRATVTRSINTVQRAHAAGVDVALAQPAVGAL